MAPTESLEKLDLREVHFRVSGPIEGLKLFLRHLAPVRPAGRTRAVLFVHGMSFPRCRLLFALMDAPGAMNSAIRALTFGVWTFTALAIRTDTPK
jgi:hypothetical protein